MTERISAGCVLYTANSERLAAFYERALGFARVGTAADHIELLAGGCQLVLLESAEAVQMAREQGGGIERRTDAAIKPIFVVASIAAARLAAANVGGVINASPNEWRFGLHRVCDGLDPDGNVIQLREVIEP